VILLYLETNFLVGRATGRDRLEWARPGLPPIRAAIPGVCFLEAFGWMEGEKKRRKAFGRALTEQLVQLRRDLTSPSAATLSVILDTAIAQNLALLDEINERLFAAVARVSSAAEILAVTAAVLEASRRTILIDESTDNLIAHNILDHARSTAGPKAFFSENHRDFGGAAVQSGLRSAGVTYLRDPDRLFEWAGAQGHVGDALG